MAKIPTTSTLNLPPTAKQTRAIAKFAQALGDSGGGALPIEHTPTNRREARDLIYKLRIQLREKNNVRQT